MTTLRKVLVVDDDPVVTKSFDRVLSNKGYAVVTARNGEEALQKIAAEDYDVVYTDIRMPGMDGIEVAEHIKGRRPWLPVVIVTGFGTADNEARAKAAGVRALLHKPLSPAMIESSAQDALAEQRVRETAALLEPLPGAAIERTAHAAVAGRASLRSWVLRSSHLPSSLFFRSSGWPRWRSMQWRRCSSGARRLRHAYQEHGALFRRAVHRSALHRRIPARDRRDTRLDGVPNPAGPRRSRDRWPGHHRHRPLVSRPLPSHRAAVHRSPSGRLARRP